MSTTEYAVIRPARFGIRNAKGYLLYWELESGSQRVDSWQIYPTIAAARAAAQHKQPDARIEEMPECLHPPSRYWTWFAGDGTLCIGCGDCGAVVRGGIDLDAPAEPLREAPKPLREELTQFYGKPKRKEKQDGG